MRALLVLALTLPMPSQPARAQTIAVFGAQTCQNWLAEPGAGGLGRYWVMGAWSGLNLGSVLRHDSADTGHSLSADDMIGLVQNACQQQPAMPLSQATAQAWTRARATGQ